MLGVIRSAGSAAILCDDCKHWLCNCPIIADQTSICTSKSSQFVEDNFYCVAKVTNFEGPDNLHMIEMRKAPLTSITEKCAKQKEKRMMKCGKGCRVMHS